jgi:hypothetical protein
MHYKDGTEAKVGDLVKGTTYNLKNAGGQPLAIVGVMLGITPGSTSCNCRVGVLRSWPSAFAVSPSISAVVYNGVPMAIHREQDGEAVFLGASVDYSQCDHLELVHRPE